MTIGNNFIFIYIPKTGSSFTIDVFKKINQKLSGFNRFKYLLSRSRLITNTVKSPNIKSRFYNFKTDQHTTVSQASEEQFKDKKIVSIIRNPFHGYISRYEYKSYANPKILENEKYKDLIISIYPKFPNLSFNEYIDFSLMMANDRLNNHIKIEPKIEIGELSVQFIQMFAYQPKEVLEILDYDFFKKGLKSKYFPDVLFLNNENLSFELYNFLRESGYPDELIDFIKVEEKKNVSVKNDNSTYLGESNKNKILALEWFLFEFFPEKKDDWF